MSDQSAIETIADVLIVDDHPMMRRGLMQLLEMEPRLNPIGQASSGEQAIKIVTQDEPDLILMDLNMPVMDGIETIRQIRNAEVHSKIIVFTVSNDHADVFRALRAGADGYLLKDMEPEDLIKSILNCAGGQQIFSPELMDVISKALRDRKIINGPSPADLTDRERQVLKLIADGQSNKMIARDLDIAEGTVKVHVKRLLNKLGMRSRVEAAVWVVENQWLL
ncbi:two-component system response regulator NarL [Gynuella sp.]|uniref:two-component system response regulator NarL n=1 Tax=Gynuella sp. TaxID=2969146 RepID=UPI003D13AD4E